MPIYEYRCEKCEHEFEREQRITDDPVKTCPECRSRRVKKLISQTSFVLKGGGWYNDLYSGASNKKKDDSDSGDGKDSKDKSGSGEGKDSKDKSGGDSKSGKSDKSQSKSSEKSSKDSPKGKKSQSAA